MNTEKVKTADAARQFADFLSRTQRRHTPERTIVLDTVLTLKGHFGTDDVCAAVEARGEHIAQATVYSTVGLLVEAGILARHIFGGKTLYEGAPARHSHSVCTVCGRVRDLRLPVLEQQARTTRIARFTPSHAAITVYGVCSACTRNSKQQNKSQSKISIR